MRAPAADLSIAIYALLIHPRLPSWSSLLASPVGTLIRLAQLNAGGEVGDGERFIRCDISWASEVNEKNLLTYTAVYFSDDDDVDVKSG